MSEIYTDPYIQASIAALDTAANIWSTSATNATNERNVERTNAANLAINQSNIEANEDLWRLNAEWNSLQAQRDRAKAAGYSPAALLGSAGFNASTSPAQVPSPIGMQSPHAERPIIGLSSVTDAIQKAHQIESQQLLNEQQRIDNASRSRRNEAEIRAKGSEADKNEWDNLITESTFNDQIVKAQAEAYEQYERGQKAKAESAVAAVESYITSRYAEDEKKKQLNILDEQLNLIVQEVSNAVKEGKNLDAARSEIFSRVGLNRANARYQNLMADYFDAVFDARVTQEVRDGKRAFYDQLFDSAHYLDQLYNEFEKSNFSVEQARELLNLYKAQRKNAELNNQFYYVHEATNMINVLESGIKTAQHGRFVDASIENMRRSHMGYRKSIRQQAAKDGFYREEIMTPHP